MKTQKKYIYGIDLAFGNTGLSVFDEETGELVYLTTISTAPTKKNGLKNNPNHKNPDMIIGLRLKYLHDELESIKKMYEPRIVLIERGFTRFNDSTQKLFRAHGIANMVFHEVENVYLPPLFIKNTIYNHGKALKSDLANLITERLGYTFKNEDESDSVAIGLAYLIEKKIVDWEINTKPPTENTKKKKKKDE